MVNLLTAGTIIQTRYQVLRMLGQGGFGAVYLAQDLRLAARKVAIKENFDNPPQSQMQFKVEADVLANLNHASLPRVMDYFIEPSGRQYLVMDYVEGFDLETIVRQSARLSEQQALPWIEQVCDGLTYLHTHQPPIIHRDVKPANIRVRASDGRAMLVDFGIAKIYDPTQKTVLGARAVSPGYSPLEQYGKGMTDARSDVYALEATMYFAFTGVQPPEATDLVSHVDQLQMPRALNPYLSQQIEQIIWKAMQLFAEARYPSVALLRQALRAPIQSSLIMPNYAPTLSATQVARAMSSANVQPTYPSIPRGVPPSTEAKSSTPRGRKVSNATLIWNSIILSILFAAVRFIALSIISFGSGGAIVFGIFALCAGPLAYLLTRRPGAAFLTQSIHSLVTFGIGGTGVLVALFSAGLLEIVFGVTNYKRYGAGIAIVASIAGSLPILIFAGFANLLFVIGAALAGVTAYLIKKVIVH